ncbi:MAG TPA: hypothetical protein VFQ27_06420 [Xanthobacteraceae bacterium]|nr:hypothetical protein [Xanthobacteraceae bacterium]
MGALFRRREIATEPTGKHICRKAMSSTPRICPMRKLTAVIAALGLLGSTSLVPAFAASASGGIEQADLSSAAKKKAKKAKTAKKAKRGAKAMPQPRPQKQGAVNATDLSAAAKKKKAKKSRAKKPEKQSILGATDLSAATSKKKAKAKKRAAPKKTGAIYYRIAA